MFTERKSLVERLIAEGVLRSKPVINAMIKVPREKFVPPELKRQSYVDTPLPIGYGKTISAPHMVAMMNELLSLEVGNRVLEIGAGSGYHAATIAEIVAPEGAVNPGHVYTVEILPELAKMAEKNLRETGYSSRVTVIQGDGSMGYAAAAPYDRILVTAAAPRIPPPLIEQLKEEGLLVLPVGGQYGFQELLTVRKEASGKVKVRSHGGCAFVPLMGEYGFSS
jgi:protein-L-isoaspartate(D-aspartate) O-methyltransferase